MKKWKIGILTATVLSLLIGIVAAAAAAQLPLKSAMTQKTFYYNTTVDKIKGNTRLLETEGWNRRRYLCVVFDGEVMAYRGENGRNILEVSDPVSREVLRVDISERGSSPIPAVGSTVRFWGRTLSDGKSGNYVMADRIKISPTDKLPEQVCCLPDGVSYSGSPVENFAGGVYQIPVSWTEEYIQADFTHKAYSRSGEKDKEFGFQYFLNALPPINETVAEVCYVFDFNINTYVENRQDSYTNSDYKAMEKEIVKNILNQGNQGKEQVKSGQVKIEDITTANGRKLHYNRSTVRMGSLDYRAEFVFFTEKTHIVCLVYIYSSGNEQHTDEVAFLVNTLDPELRRK